MNEFSHLDAEGRARMVDVGGKQATRRLARAEVRVDLGPAAFEKLTAGHLAKGDAFAVARVAGIQAAKAAGFSIPLCHPVALDHARIDFDSEPDAHVIRIVCEAATTARTGVEMEALSGAAAAALALYDMCKAVERGIVIDGLRLVHKEGGKSGTYAVPHPEAGEDPA